MRVDAHNFSHSLAILLFSTHLLHSQGGGNVTFEALDGHLELQADVTSENKNRKGFYET
jgi:hypothetical protein